MKLKNFIYTIILLVTFNSCSDWLTVYPKTEMPSNVQFASEQGYKDAVAGVYTLMKSSTLYGAGLSFTNIEYMASLWDVSTDTAPYYLALHQFTNTTAKEITDAIYVKQYNVIVNINSILENIDKDTTIFKTPGTYKLIKGECLALRAFIHFDIMRMFGPVPSTGDVGSIKTIPYVTKVSKDINVPITYDEFKTQIFNDFTEAETLLAGVDPILNYSVKALKIPSSSGYFAPSDFFVHRIIRMNYYAVKALQARAYLWYGEKQLAYESALAVINATNPDGTKKFTLGSSDDFANTNYNFPTEHIFCMYDYSLYKKYSDNFATGTLKKGSTVASIKTTMFGNTGTDIRELNLWELITLSNNTTCHILKKYLVPETPFDLNTDFRQIPVIRLSELYLIAVEAASDQTLWDDFRNTRGIAALTLPADEIALKTAILMEFRKEFYGEGQLFYLYKRFNTVKTSILFYNSSLVVNYVVPLPETELK